MGCMHDRHQIINEEQTMLAMESCLEYNGLSSKDLDFTIRKYSFEQKINLNQFITIADVFQLPTKKSVFCPNIEKFYGDFFDTHGFISFKDFSILTILLSTEQIRTKARLIFEIFDVFNEKVLNASFAVNLFEDIAKVALIKIPILVSNLTNPPAGQMQIYEYISKLLLTASKAREAFVMLVTEGKSRVSLTEFMNKFDLEENS